MLNQHEEKLHHCILSSSAILQPTSSLSDFIQVCSECVLLIYHVIQRGKKKNTNVLNEASLSLFEEKCLIAARCYHMFVFLNVLLLIRNSTMTVKANNFFKDTLLFFLSWFCCLLQHLFLNLCHYLEYCFLN